MTNKEQIEYQNDYIAKRYDRFTLTFHAGLKEVYREYAKRKGKSLNAYINELLEKDMKENAES